jgi:uncharacterized protein YpmS
LNLPVFAGFAVTFPEKAELRRIPWLNGTGLASPSFYRVLRLGRFTFALGGQMRKFLLLAAAAVALLTAGSLFWAYRASQFVPERYAELIGRDPSAQANASTEMFNRSQRLVNDVKRPGKWQATFTSEQINGYFAVDFEKQFRHALPGEIQDPRVHIGEKTVTLFCRYDGPGGESVLSLELEPFLADRDALGLRLVDARAGSLPLPVGRVREVLSEAAHVAELAVRWVDEDGQPVALIAMPTTKHGRRVELTHLELAGEEIRLGGEIPRR